MNPLNLFKYLPYLLRKKFNQKYIIIESDDWGMSQNTSYSGIEFLEKKFGREKFTRWTTDSLETCEDLNLLFGILNKYKTWAEWTTGSIYPMVTPDTIELITQNTIKQHAERILTNDYKGIIEENSIFQQEIFVSPGTSELEIVMFRSKTEGNVEIITPGGVNRTTGNYGPTDLLETPFVSIWKFTDPTPGKWLFKIYKRFS